MSAAVLFKPAASANWSKSWLFLSMAEIDGCCCCCSSKHSRAAFKLDDGDVEGEEIDARGCAGGGGGVLKFTDDELCNCPAVMADVAASSSATPATSSKAYNVLYNSMYFKHDIVKILFCTYDVADFKSAIRVQAYLL